MMNTNKKMKSSGEYPDDNNPFDLDKNVEKSTKNGKKKKKLKENREKETNPFLMKPTKSMKKREKKAKKTQKEEDKKVEKNEKTRKSNNNKSSIADSNFINNDSIDDQETKNDQTNSEKNIEKSSAISQNTSHTLPSPAKAENDKSSNYNIGASNTIDVRISPPTAEMPILPNKRLMQLKTGRDSGEISPNSSLPDLTQKTHYQYRPAHSKNAHNTGVDAVTDKTSFSSKGSLPHHSSQRPNYLNVSSQATQRLPSPSSEHRSPSPLVPRNHQETDDIKMYRTQSISKKRKDKKKKKKLKGFLKKKKKSKNGKQTTIFEDQVVTEQVVLRRPRLNNVDTLRKEVEDVQQSLRTSVISLVEQRNSNLDRLTQNMDELEEFAHGFATCATETRLKKQAQATCCGIGSRWKICWYICACKRKVKRRKRGDKKAIDRNAPPESHNLLATRQAEDDDDYYRPTVPESTQETKVQIAPKTLSSSVDNLSTQLPRYGETEHPRSLILKNKLLNFPKALRGSMPNLFDSTPPMGRSLRSMAEIDPRERKSSSVNALHDIVKMRGAKKREERMKKEKTKQEEEISNFASQYEDDDTRKKVEGLLRLDL